MSQCCYSDATHLACITWDICTGNQPGNQSHFSMADAHYDFARRITLLAEMDRVQSITQGSIVSVPGILPRSEPACLHKRTKRGIQIRSATRHLASHADLDASKRHRQSFSPRLTPPSRS